MPSDMIELSDAELRALDPDPFVFRDFTEALISPAKPEPGERYLMSRWFAVNVKTVDGGPMGPLTWLSIRRQDRRAIRDWRTMQLIKNSICGPEREAVELFPAASRTVDTSNQHHLWVLAAGVRMPFGFDERSVWDTPDAEFFSRSIHGTDAARQRPFDEEVRALTYTPEEPEVICNRHRKPAKLRRDGTIYHERDCY